MNKSKAVNKMKEADLTEKSGQLWENRNKSWVILLVENKTPETVSRHKQYNEKIKNKKQRLFNAVSLRQQGKGQKIGPQSIQRITWSRKK